MDSVSVVLAILVAAVVWLGWRFARLGHDVSRLARDPTDSLRLLQREVEAVRAGVDVRLREHLEHSRELGARLGWLQKAMEEVERLGAALGELQKILQPSALRGAYGERLLIDLLSDVLPRNRFRVQYTYPVSGVRVDVAITLGDGRILPIDSKFPLDNFKRSRGRSDGEMEAARRAFGHDVRRHIDDIAARYLSPEDGTIDIAFMYIPSEAVFHELTFWDLNGSTLIDYALKRRVIPVSPNTMQAYLSVVRMGLRGFSLQRRARDVLQHIIKLGSDVEELRAELSRARKQARHSMNNLREADNALGRVEERLALLSNLGSGSGPDDGSTQLGSLGGIESRAEIGDE